MELGPEGMPLNEMQLVCVCARLLFYLFTVSAFALVNREIIVSKARCSVLILLPRFCLFYKALKMSVSSQTVNLHIWMVNAP